MTKMVSRLQNRGVSDAWYGWCDFIATEKHHRRALMTSSTRMLQGDLSSAFYTWFDTATENQFQATYDALTAEKMGRLEAMEAAATGRALLEKLQASYVQLQTDTTAAITQTRAWADARVVQALAGQSQANKGLSELLFERMNTLMALPGWREIAILRMDSAFERWASRTKHLRDIKRRTTALMTRMVARLTDHLITSAWSAWRELVDESKRQEVVFKKAASRLFRGQLAATWNTWLLRCDVANAHRNILQRVVGRLGKMSLATAMSQWVEVVATAQIRRARETEIIARVLARFDSRSLWSALATWIEVWDTQKYLAADLQRRQQTGTRAVKRLQNKVIDGAFRRWTEMTRTQKRHRLILGTILARISRTGLSSAFDRWTEMTATQKRHRTILRSILTRMSQASLSSSFDGWRFGITQEKKRHRILIQFTARMQHTLLWKIVSTWRAWVSELKRQQAIAAKVVGHLIHSSLSAPFKQWAISARKQRVVNAARRKVFAKMTHLFLSSAWNGWCDVIAFALSNRALVSRILGRMQHAVLAGSFGKWLDIVKGVTYARAVIARTIKRLTNRHMDKVFATWSNVCYLRKTMKKISMRMQNRVVSLSFTTWERHAAARKKLWLGAKIPDVAQDRIDELENAAAKASAEAQDCRNAMNAEGPLALLEKCEAELAEVRSESAQLRSIVAANRENAQFEIESGFKKGEQQAKRQVLLNERQKRERREQQLHAAEEATRKAQLAEEDFKRRHRADADHNRRVKEDLERQYAERHRETERQHEETQERFEQVMLSFYVHRSERSRRDVLWRSLQLWADVCAASGTVPEGVPPTPTRLSQQQQHQPETPPRTVARTPPASPRLLAARAAVAAAEPRTPVGTAAASPSAMRTGKLSKWHKGEWRSRWVELVSVKPASPEDAEAAPPVWLVLRKNKESTRDLGRIDLTECHLLADDTGKLAFTVVNRNTEEHFLFAAETGEECAGWVAAVLSVTAGSM